jgi:outer membrane receptor for ferrienterochelin and colicins
MGSIKNLISMGHKIKKILVKFCFLGKIPGWKAINFQKDRVNHSINEEILFIFVLIIFNGLTFNLGLSSGGKIVGRIIDKETGQPLPGANVVIEKTLFGAGSDADGRYIIPQVPTGRWEIKATFIGYSPQQHLLSVENDSLYQLDFNLTPSAILFEQIVVTGSRQAEDLSQAANSVNVLPSSEILLRSHLKMETALQRLPAVDLVGENISVRGGTGYSFLSLGGSRVLMLVDDVPMLTSDFGRANWDFLPITELERVEVLKGAASVLYGSGGISGVVNLISRGPTIKPHFAFRSSIGMYSDPSVPQWKWTNRRLHFHRTDFSYSQSIGSLGLRFSLSRDLDTGYRENSSRQRWYFTARPVLNFRDGSNLSLFFAYTREKRGLFFLWTGQNKALSTPYSDTAEVDGFLLSAIYNKVFSPIFMIMTRFSINSQLLGLPLSTTVGFEPALGFSGELRAIWLFKQRHSLTMGVDYRHDVAESGFFGSHQADTYSPYLQDTWEFKEFLHLNVGVRYDYYSLYGESPETQISPKFGVSFEPFPNTILHTSIGRGFRAPTIMERFTDHDLQEAAQLIKNPDLQPERANLFDIGLRQRVNHMFSLELSGFLSDYYNLIELTQVSDINLIMQFRNYPRARISGVESQLNLQLFGNHINFLMNGTYMHSENLQDDTILKIKKGELLPYRPKFSLFFVPTLTFGPLSFESEYRYISRFDRVSFFPNEERVAQKVLNLRARYQWKQWLLIVQVKNVINHNHTIVEQNIDEIRNFSFSFATEF